jgi:Flp pilus assembly protein TadD
MTDVTETAQHRGRALLDLGRPAEAERVIRQALSARPDDAELHHLMGRALLAQERCDEAIESSRRALASDPQHVGAMYLLACAHAAEGDNDRARHVVDGALQVAPEAAALHSLKGAILARQGFTEAALTSVEHARGLDPEDPDVVAHHAAVLYDLRRNPEAAAAVADALALDPDHAEAHRLRGLLALRGGGSKVALEASRQALRLDPTDPNYRHDLAMAMKARNPLYALLYRVGDWQSSLPGAARYAFILAPFVLNRALRPFDDHLWARVLLVLVVGAVLVMWALEPLMNTVLLCSRFARRLLPRDATLATYGFLAYLATAAGCAVTGLVSGRGEPVLLGAALGLWAMSAGQAHTIRPRLRRLAVVLHLVGGLVALAAVLSLALTGTAGALLTVVLVAGIAMLWFTSFA